MKPLQWPMTAALPWRAGVLGMAVITAAIAGGCGVGSAGTGTGDALIAFTAVPVPVCGTALAPSLDCLGGASAGASGGTRAVLFVDAAARVGLRVEGEEATLAAPCADLRFQGVSGRGPDASDAFFGWVTTPRGSEPARLRVEPAADGTLTIDLGNAAGVVRLQAGSLARAAALAPLPQRCPS